MVSVLMLSVPTLAASPAAVPKAVPAARLTVTPASAVT